MEDFSRYKSDKETNRQKAWKVLDDGTTKEIYSSDIEVGDIVFVPEDQMFSADVILIESSNEGTCFIQTSSLDGEKNLKKRMKPKDFQINSQNAPTQSNTLGGKNERPSNRGVYPTFKGRCECDEPNAELYEFSGNLKIEKKNYALSAT